MSPAAPDLLPMQDLLYDFSKITKLIVCNTVAHSTVYEDNTPPNFILKASILGSNTTAFMIMSLQVPSRSKG
jgi:hypothetical protein